MLVTRFPLWLASVSLIALMLPSLVEAGDRTVVFAPAPAATAPAATVPAKAAAMPEAATTGSVSAARPAPAAGSGEMLAPTEATAAAPEATDPPIGPVDESALRYYASQNAMSRVDAEIRRLRTLHPGWEPPADLYRPNRAGDDQALWDLYAKDRIDELRAEIDRRVAREPGWKPSAELETKIRLKDARRRLVVASDRADHAGVIEIARSDAGLVTEDDPDMVWRVAQAHASTGDATRAGELFAMVLASPASAEVRLATVRKALAVLPPPVVEQLIAAAPARADKPDEFAPVRDDLVRARIGAVLTTQPPQPARADDVARLTALAALPTASASDLEMLGWLAHRDARPAEARRWFEQSITRQASPQAQRGLALSLRALGEMAAAEALAYAHRERDDEMATLYLEIVATELTRERPPAITADRLTAFAAETRRLQSGDGAQAIGWYAYKVRQYPAAVAWFEEALRWKPTAKTAEGHLLALRAGGDQVRFATEFANHRVRFPELARLDAPASKGGAATPARGAGAVDGPSRQAFAAHKRGDHRGCLAILTERAARGPLSGEDELLRGWCLLDLQRPQEAAIAFERAQAMTRGQRHEDAAYGRSLAHLRGGRTLEASHAAASAALSAERQAELARVVLAQNAIALFDRRRYGEAVAILDERRRIAEEPRDLATMRAWALHHLGRSDEARAYFLLLDRQMSTRETRAGLAAVSDRLAAHQLKW